VSSHINTKRKLILQ